MNEKKQYNFQKIEQNLDISHWTYLADGTIHDPNKPFFSIILPPPNVTGTLHLGHAWDAIIQDVLIRYYRLKKFNVFWAPGMDHAGIATQTKFEKELKEQKQVRYDFAREEFNAKMHSWVNNFATIIRKQWKSLGLLIPYQKERFTLDQKANQIVLNAFKKLYYQKYAYQAKRLVNWDTELKTAISNIEVIYKTTQVELYYIDYALADDPEIKLTIATSRPETMFADVCLLYNPKDQRYQKFKNKMVINPANNQIIPIYEDNHIDSSFGTGLMKCTPGHDFNDWDIGLRLNLPIISCIDESGKMINVPKMFLNTSTKECRKILIEQFQKCNILKIEPYTTNIGYSERTNVIIEPLLSKQWFIKSSLMAKEVLIHLEKNPNELKFWPESFTKKIIQYLTNMDDWCISRQLWWGHQIPIYYNIKTQEIQCSITTLNKEEWKQDSDVFDTWFSSSLWPIITAENYFDSSLELNSFFPSSVLVTGVDILFFWVSRMMMLNYFFKKKMPFQNVFLHGLIRDEKNQKMSKSLNNGVDPNLLIQKYGVDAIRLFFLTYTNNGEDLIFQEEKIKVSTNFLIKFWNAYQFLLIKKINLTNLKFIYQELKWHERWIYNIILNLKKEIKKNYQQYQLNLISRKIIHFVWENFCSWFLEFTKIIEQKHNNINENFIAWIWHEILILLNPIIPFITEKIFSEIHLNKINIYQFKNYTNNDHSIVVLENNWILDFIVNIRNIRSILNIKNHDILDFNIIVDDTKNKLLIDEIKKFQDYFSVVNVNFIATKNQSDNKNKINFVIQDYLFEIICTNMQVENYQLFLKKKIENLQNEVKRSKNILKNPAFIQNAAFEKIELEKNKKIQYEKELAQLSQEYNLQK